MFVGLLIKGVDLNTLGFCTNGSVHMQIKAFEKLVFNTDIH